VEHITPDPFETMSDAQFQAWINCRLEEIETVERGDFVSVLDEESFARLIGE